MSAENMDLTNMLKDVNQVLHSHLSNILNPILLEKQTINQVLLNMPYVKKKNIPGGTTEGGYKRRCRTCDKPFVG